MKLNTKRITKKLKDKFRKPIYVLLAVIVLCSHDLYIKMETYFLQPNQEATLSLYNGTFENSENIIMRNRMLDASIVSKGERVAINPNQWKDQDSTITQLAFKTGEEGTYVVGVSTKARNIELTADKFNSYLEHDGVLDMLQYRTNNNLLTQDAVESYQKHVKAIYQVGIERTNDWNTVLGYPIEFVPQANPYEKHSDDTLEIQLLLDGKPLPNQLVYADYIKGIHAHAEGDHNHEHDQGEEAHSHDEAQANDEEHQHTHESKSEETHSHDHAHTNGEEHQHTHESKSKEAHSHDHAHTDGEKHQHTHKSEKEEVHTHTSGQKLLTNDQGIIALNLLEEGIYYLRTIHMINVTDSDELTHRSKWATLTFEVSHKHDSSTHTHDEHEHEEGVPTWVFILGSLLIIGLLFFVFRK